MKKYTVWMVLAIVFILAAATFITLYIMERKKQMQNRNASNSNDLEVVTDALGRKFPKAGSVKYTNSKGETFSSNL